MGVLKDVAKVTKQKAGELAEKAKAEVERKKEEERLRKEENERKFRESFPFQRMYNIRKDTKQKPEYWEKVTNHTYVVTDENEKPIYIAKENFWIENYRFKVTNSDKEVVGFIRKHLFNFGFPFVKERKGCTIKLADNSFKARLTTYISFNKREFGGTEGTISVVLENTDKLGSENIYKVSKSGSNKNFSKVYRIRSDEGFFKDRFVVGFDNEEDAILATLIAIGINMIRYEVY